MYILVCTFFHSGSSLARGAATSGRGGGSRCRTDRSTSADLRSSSDVDDDGEIFYSMALVVLPASHRFNVNSK